MTKLEFKEGDEVELTVEVDRLNGLTDLYVRFVDNTPGEDLVYLLKSRSSSIDYWVEESSIKLKKTLEELMEDYLGDMHS